jgi:SAM-dependent methyltransferase
MIDKDYNFLKQYYDIVLNKDKSTYKNSNDEPTPIGCIEEMLDKIPDSAWKKGAKILDPCCGNGNFHLYAYNKLKQKSVPHDEIISNSLFFNDINFERLQNVRDIYGKEANITLFDFLKYPEEEKYDIIYANPPYAKFTKDNKRASKNHTMVRDFLSKSLKMLKKGGYLVYIIPNNWMSYADRNQVISEITSKQIIYLNIHGAKKWFPKIGSSFTWLVVQNLPAKKHYDVDCIYRGETYTDKVSGKERNFIPLLWTKKVQSIFSKTIEASGQKYDVQTSSDLHKYTKKNLIEDSQDNKHTYRLIHTPKTTVWASRPHKFQEGYKCFISTTDKYKTFVDNCGMTQSIAFIRCDDKKEADSICNILKHDLYVFLNNLCRWGNFNNIRILQKFPIPKDPNNIYKSFGITKEEQEYIEKILKK